MKKHIVKHYRDGEYQYSREAYREYAHFDYKWVKGEFDKVRWFQRYDYVKVYSHTTSYNWTARWGNWIPDETSRWFYKHEYAWGSHYSWLQQAKRDEHDKQDRRDDRVFFKIKTERDMIRDPWAERYGHHRGSKTYGFKSWKHATKHRKQWMKNL